MDTHYGCGGNVEKISAGEHNEYLRCQKCGQGTPWSGRIWTDDDIPRLVCPECDGTGEFRKLERDFAMGGKLVLRKTRRCSRCLGQRWIVDEKRRDLLGSTNLFTKEMSQ